MLQQRLPKRLSLKDLTTHITFLCLFSDSTYSSTSSMRQKRIKKENNNHISAHLNGSSKVLSQSLSLLTSPSLVSPNPNENESQYSDSGSASAERKRKKARTTFTGRQIFELERQFECKKYLSSSERSELAKLLGVTETQVGCFFCSSIFFFFNLLIAMPKIQTYRRSHMMIKF